MSPFCFNIKIILNCVVTKLQLKSMYFLEGVEGHFSFPQVIMVIIGVLSAAEELYPTVVEDLLVDSALHDKSFMLYKENILLKF